MTVRHGKEDEPRQASLDYHEHPGPGKVAVSATRQLINQRDLALGYSPGVAAACEEIVADPDRAFRYTSRGSLVALVSNGTAVLGLAMPDIDAANIAYDLSKTAAVGGIAIGPVLLGATKPVHIHTPSATVRRIVNLTALTVSQCNPSSRGRRHCFHYPDRTYA